MSRRDRLRAQREASIRDRARRPRDGAPRRRRLGAEPPDPASQLERLTLALLPLRAFLGVTFVYAGVDKLIDPNFLQATGPGSIGSQLDGFVKVSPIAPLVQIFGQPFPVAVGLLIAITEIADRPRRAERPPVPSGRGRWPCPVTSVLADGIVGDEAVLLRARPAVRTRLADPRAGRYRRSVHHRSVAGPRVRGRVGR